MPASTCFEATPLYWWGAKRADLVREPSVLLKTSRAAIATVVSKPNMLLGTKVSH